MAKWSPPPPLQLLLVLNFRTLRGRNKTLSPLFFLWDCGISLLKSNELLRFLEVYQMTLSILKSIQNKSTKKIWHLINNFKFANVVIFQLNAPLWVGLTDFFKIRVRFYFLRIGFGYTRIFKKHIHGIFFQMKNYIF